jgi:hypothetical protein
MMWTRRGNNPSQGLPGILRQLETRLEKLIEGSAERVFPSARSQHDLAESLEKAMRQGIQLSADGVLFGPNLFVIEVHPSHVNELATNFTLLDGLTRIIAEEGYAANLKFASPIVLQVSPSEEVLPGETRIIARQSLDGLTGTTAVETDTDGRGGLEDAPRGAYLVVDGVQVFALRRPVVNIGRRNDNHLVINDSRVSRIHAQLRALRGQYVIFDLDSTGGTWVNGERIRQRVLRPGDVVSLSGVPLIYGQDADEVDSTQRLPG